MWTYGRCGMSPTSSAASRLTPFPMCSPMSIDAGCGGSRVGPQSRSTTWLTSGAHKGTWSRNTEVVVVLGGGLVFALICRGARTCVSVVYSHGQSVMVKMH